MSSVRPAGRTSIARLATASLALSALAVAWIACASSSAPASPPTELDDASALDAAPFADAPLPVDDAGGADTAPQGPRAKVTFVHAAPGVFPVRLCLGIETPTELVSLVDPLPNNAARQGSAPYLGVFPGTAMVLPDLTDLDAVDVTLFAINAALIASDTSAGTEADCPTLLGVRGLGSDASTLVPNVDFVQLPTIPQGTFAHGGSFALVLEGCPADPHGALGYSTAVCGANWVSGAGNVALQIFRVDNASNPGAALGLQVIHASSAWDGLMAADAGAIANTFGFYDDASDAAALTPIAQGVRFGSMTPMDAAAPAAFVVANYASSGLYTLATAADGGPLVGYGGPYPFPFAQIQPISGDGAAYAAGVNFTAVWLGDPRQPAYVAPDAGALDDDAGGAFNAASPHFLLLPSDPSVPAP